MTNEQLHDYLRQYHRGEAAGVTATELQRQFNTTSREIRDVVSSLRRQEVPICSGDSGYFYAESCEEIGRSVRHMSNRIRNIAGARNGLMIALFQMTEQRENGGGYL